MRRNPVEFVVSGGAHARDFAVNHPVKPAHTPGVQTRLIRAGETTTPGFIARFYLSDAKGQFAFRNAKGDFDFRPFMPERGVLKVLVDAGATYNQDRFTPLGLWHRFFQSAAVLARVDRPKAYKQKRFSFRDERYEPEQLPFVHAGRRFGVLFDHEHGEGAARAAGHQWADDLEVVPWTAWLRAGNLYRGREGAYDAMGMAMTFPGGIVYGLSPRSGTDAQRAAIRPVIEAWQREDTQRVRDWVRARAAEGCVTSTSTDQRYSRGDFLNDTVRDDEYAAEGGGVHVSRYLMGLRR